MGFAALHKEFEDLNRVTRVQTQAVAKAGEVVSIVIGKLIRQTNKITEAYLDMRAVFLAGVHKIEDFQSQLTSISDEDVAKVGLVRASVAKLERRLSYSMLATLDGTSMLTPASAYRSLKTPSADDGRTARRLAKRIEDAAGACDEQRIRLLDAVSKFLVHIDCLIATSRRTEEIEEAYEQSLAGNIANRYPVIIEHLAK